VVVVVVCVFFFAVLSSAWIAVAGRCPRVVLVGFRWRLQCWEPGGGESLHSHIARAITAIATLRTAMVCMSRPGERVVVVLLAHNLKQGVAPSSGWAPQADCSPAMNHCLTGTPLLPMTASCSVLCSACPPTPPPTPLSLLPHREHQWSPPDPMLTSRAACRPPGSACSPTGCGCRLRWTAAWARELVAACSRPPSRLGLPWARGHAQAPASSARFRFGMRVWCPSASRTTTTLWAANGSRTDTDTWAIALQGVPRHAAPGVA
jgi:hypothetical protein